jgi:GT2 family glycosyltransferase
MGYLPTSSGGNFGCRRSTWQAVGGFDEDLVTCEDIDFGWRVQQAGFRFAQCPDAVIAYRVPQDTRALLRKWFSYGYFQVRLYEKHRDHGMARRRPLRALARLGLLLLTSYHALSRNDERRRRWCMQVGRRLGSIKGSIDERVLFL